MVKPRVNRWLLPALLMLLPAAVPGTAAATSNVYQVEVVVFENRLPALEGGEIWSHDHPQTETADTADAVNAGVTPPPDSPLAAAAEALEKSGRHPVLAHLTWEQTADAKSVTKPVKIADASGKLSGTLRFYLSRFLYVDLDLALKAPPGAGVPAGTAGGAPVYHLDEHRRVRIAEINYFDHPKFGALVRVAPLKAN
jgi:hypothetical protein